MATHAIHSLSKLPIWAGKCAGFLSSDEVTAASERGTNKGELVQRCIWEGKEPDNDPLVEFAVGTIRRLISLDGKEIIPEYWVDTGIEGVSGYLDLCVIDRFLDECYNVELKTGFGTRAPAPENEQVMAQNVGLMRTAGVDAVTAYMIEMDKREVSTVTHTREQLPELDNRIAEIVKSHRKASTMEYPDMLTPTPYCNYCRRKTTCPQLITAPADSLALIGDTLYEPKEYVKALSVESLADILTKVLPVFDRAEAYVNAIKGRAYQIIEAGGDVPGWTVRTTPGNRKWSDEHSALDEITKEGYNVRSMIELMSPASVEKMLKKEHRDIVAKYTVSGAPKKSLKPTNAMKEGKDEGSKN